MEICISVKECININIGGNTFITRTIETILSNLGVALPCPTDIAMYCIKAMNPIQYTAVKTVKLNQPFAHLKKIFKKASFKKMLRQIGITSNAQGHNIFSENILEWYQ